MAWSLQTAPLLSDQQFNAWNKLLEDRTGVQILPGQRALLQTQLGMRMRELGIADYDEYYRHITDGLKGALEWTVLVDRVVVKESSFFRHRPSISLVRQLLQERIDNRTLQDNFEIWSIGCSTGEEPYSLAMMVNDCFELAGLEPYYGITGTDISQTALQIARAGIYSARKLETISGDEKNRYFTATADGKFQVAGKLRDRVCFSQGNVLNISQMPQVSMDVIFCQNLLIYFRRWRRRELLAAMVSRLKPGGLLVIGLGEIVEWEHPDIRRIANDQLQAYTKIQ